jgi:putative hydrolase of the HAD superfamily
LAGKKLPSQPVMKNKKYTHVFFDLDHTLWDFDANNLLTFDEILTNYQVYQRGIPDLQSFMRVYTDHNKALWDLYKADKIEKSFLSVTRFRLTLKNFGIDDPELSAVIADDYIRISPTKTLLREGTFEILSYLRLRYNLGLITNGFNEIQFIKIGNAGLEPYFPIIVTSEEAGCKKPCPEIFNYTLSKAGARAEKSIYIGDEPETDVPGAREAGVDQVIVTFGQEFSFTGATFTVDTLLDLKSIL